MLSMAICDDDDKELVAITELLRQFCTERNEKIAFDAYQSPIELLAGIQKGRRYDVMLLDVVMPGMSGIAAAHEIRETDQYTKIIFLTSSPEFAIQSYAVGAYYYQLKPIWKDTFFKLIEKVIKEIGRQQRDSLIIKCKTGITRIQLEQLEYCEVIGKSVFFHMISGLVYECAGKLEKIGGMLKKYPNFFQPHRSYIINFDYVLQITARTITMECMAQIPIPHGKYTEVKDSYLAQAFRKGRGFIERADTCHQ